MKNTLKVILIILFFASIASLFLLNTPLRENNQTGYQFKESATLGSYALNLARADTKAGLIKGLSGHRQLLPHEGLLFVFPETSIYGIWMKDMGFPIDVFWLDENFRVVWIKRDFLPESFPEVALPEVKARYVLEVASSVAEKAQIKIGDNLQFIK